MSKKKQHNIWTKVWSLSHWYFLTLFIICSLVTVFALRQNNLTALRLRDQVLEVDKQNGDVETALKELREFVYSHMNADLSAGTGIQQPIQLKYRYERLVAAEKARLQKANQSIYTAAQKHCEQKYPGSFSGGPRVPCIAQYVSNRGVKEQPVADDLYKFDFVSPRWSPDLAGISMVLAGVFLFLFVARFCLERWLRLELSDL